MSEGRLKAVPLEAQDLDRALTRMAHEILERNRGVEGLALVGIKTRGEVLARRLAARIVRIEQPAQGLLVGALDVTFYRDDTAARPARPASASELAFSVEGRTVVLVDDVLFTGRTVRAGLDAIADFGRPKAVRLAVLVDRGGRELPIQPDHVALVDRQVPLTHRVKVKLVERDGSDEIVIEPRQ